MHEAIKSNDYDLIEELLSDGEDPNEVDLDGNMPLDITTDPDIEDLLFMFGAYRDPEYYSKMRYYANYEDVFYFDEKLRDEVVAKIMSLYDTNIENASDEIIEEANNGIFYDLKKIGVKSIVNGIPQYTSNYESTYDINDLLERCGYVVSYKGPDNKLEGQPGVYFVE